MKNGPDDDDYDKYLIHEPEDDGDDYNDATINSGKEHD